MVAQSSAQASKGYKGPIGMNGLIARWYASLTRKSMNTYVNDAKRMAALLAPGGSMLEVAPGPGYLAVALAKLGDYRVTGLDISQTFVDIGRENAKQAGVRVDFRQGNASQMPFEEGTFDLIVCRAAFKNFAAPVDAIREMYRVLKPGGRAVIIDMRNNAPSADIDREVDQMGLGLINRFLTRITFKKMLIKRAYSADAFRQMVAQTRFQKADIQEEGIGLEVRLQK